jgi:hypothetical protein
MSKNEKHQAEARQQGWTFAAKTKRGYANYIHNACGHEQQAQTGAMGNGYVRCRHCKEQAWRDSAAAQGWTFVAKINDTYATYVHNACGHEQQTTTSSMSKGEVRCRHCTEQVWRDKATAQGWTFVAQVNGQYANYIHNACGHEQQVQFSGMGVGQVRCQHCAKEQWRNEAAVQGWTLCASIGKACATYVHNACGHEQQSKMSCMRLGSVVCHGCGESWATKPSNLYLLDITTACGQRFLKLGIARVVTRRARGYGLVEGAKIKLLYAKAYATGAEAFTVEKKLHKTATKFHPSIRKFKGAKKLMVSGHTECYEYSPEAANYLLFNLQF